MNKVLDFPRRRPAARAFDHRSVPLHATGRTLRAIIEWPRGLRAAPVVYAIGETDVETAAIFEALGKVAENRRALAYQLI